MTFKSTRRVEFHDTDMAGIMHFSAYFRFMEAAEHELLRHLGTSVVADSPEGRISWPRVSATCDFSAPARFEDVLEIEVRVSRLGTKSVTYDFTFTDAGKQLARGQMTSVCCRVMPDGSPRSTDIPLELVAKLKQFA